MSKKEEISEEVLEEGEEVMKEVSESQEEDLKVENSEKQEEDLGEELTEKVFTNIKKLKCDYTTYKEERTKCKLPIEEKCAKCGKKFKNGDELYTAFEERNQKNCIICKKCANKIDK